MQKKLSIVIPVFNEEENVKKLYSELKEVLDRIDYISEIIFVDDGSTDKTPEILEELSRTDKRIKLIFFSRNYGQTPAISAGIEHSSGDIIITIDADLQNDPSDIPVLLKEIESGYDVVSGWRKNRKDPFFTRRLPSYIANAMISKLTGVKLHDYGCTLKAYRAEIIKKFAIYGEMHRFLPAYCSWQGGKITEVVVNHRPRLYGKSKYGINRTFKVILDLIVVKFLLSYLTKPIYIFGGIGIFMFISGTVVNIFVFIRKIFLKGQWLSPLFFIGFLLWTLSIICILLGFVMEVLVRLYIESKEKLPFRISRKVNL